MKAPDWFKAMIGKKVIASKDDSKYGTIVVRDEAHADHLYKAQEEHAHDFHDTSEDDDMLIPIVTGVLIGEMLSDSGSSFDNSSAPDVPATDFDGGSFGGGGAEANW